MGTNEDPSNTIEKLMWKVLVWLNSKITLTYSSRTKYTVNMAPELQSLNNFYFRKQVNSSILCLIKAATRTCFAQELPGLNINFICMNWSVVTELIRCDGPMILIGPSLRQCVEIHKGLYWNAVPFYCRNVSKTTSWYERCDSFH